MGVKTMFNEKFFMNRMEENVCYNLIFPFHIHLDKVKGTDYFNPNYPDSYHEHTFASVLSLAYREPEAFYLTDEDKTFYSTQEIAFIERVISREKERISEGYELVNVDFDEETIRKIDEYRFEHNLTFDEAVIDILKKSIEMSKNISNKKDNESE